jgi:hypothetical protein
LSDDGEQPFQRDELVDKPGIVGARWWQDGLEKADPIARRAALRTMLGGAVAVAAAGGLVAAINAAARSGPSADDFDTVARASIDMQREYGWNFGAATESLVFNGVSSQPFDRSALAHLADDLAPAQPELRPFYVPTLAQSLSAQRKTTPPGDPSTFTPLVDAMKPIFTPAMESAFKAGKALASLFEDKTHPGAYTVGVVVDMPGPESVAFAAGAASALDPVFLLDNWPHPRGVVPSHLALAAAAYYQPLFAQARTLAKGAAPPLFVLDRTRLAPYRDDASQFDNRYVQRLPSKQRLVTLGLSRVLYVVRSDAERAELDDLNEDFVYAQRNGVPVRMVAADTFGPSTSAPNHAPAGDASAPSTERPFYYGYDPDCHEWFWIDYPYSDHPVARREPTLSRRARDYTPAPRPSQFSSGTTLAPSHPRPSGFGTVPVVIAVATGVVMGARMSRSGSWTRASGWGGG